MTVTHCLVSDVGRQEVVIVCFLTWPRINPPESSRRQRQTRHNYTPCRVRGSVKNAVNAITTGCPAVTSSTPQYATGRQRVEVSLRLALLTQHCCLRVCGGAAYRADFLLFQGYPSDWSVLVAMVTDLPLDGVFNREREETSHNNASPEAERRLKDDKEEESGGLVRAEKNHITWFVWNCIYL